jgi:exoribonuclease R
VVTRLVAAPRIDFTDLRRELDLPTQFPPEAQREAEEAARAGSPPATDRTDVALVTIDPPTSRDLDQAVCLGRRDGGGYRVWYAIADVSAFVRPGGALEAETWRRGQTVYLPDGKVPLHPETLSEGAGSLLPDSDRRAVLWTIDLDADGTTVDVRVERALVRSRAKLDYEGVQASADAETLVDSIALLPEIGKLLIARGLARGAVNLPIPAQEVEPDDGGWRLVLRPAVPAEEWNAQISLLTGMSAARLMLTGKVGLLRTMPRPHPAAVKALRVAATTLGIDWPHGASLGRVLAEVDVSTARGAAFVDHAAELMRGAAYTAFDGTVPAEAEHGAVAAAYAHVTAPLRRLADRYATEVCLALFHGNEVPGWVRAALPKLPEVMATTDRKASAAERGAVDLAEAILLADRVGEQFDAAVIDVDGGERRNGRPGGDIVLDDPPVKARCRGTLPLGERISATLVEADPKRRLVRFAYEPSGG